MPQETAAFFIEKYRRTRYEMEVVKKRKMMQDTKTQEEKIWKKEKK